MYPILVHGILEFYPGKTQEFLKALLEQETHEALSLLEDFSRPIPSESERRAYFYVPSLHISAPILDPGNPEHKRLWEIFAHIVVQCLKKKVVSSQLHNKKELRLNVTLILQPAKGNESTIKRLETSIRKHSKKEQRELAYYEDFPCDVDRSSDDSVREICRLVRNEKHIRVLGAEITAEFIGPERYSSFFGYTSFPLRRIFRKINPRYDFLLPHLDMYHLFNLKTSLFDSRTLLMYAVFRGKPSITNVDMYDVFFPESEEVEEFFRFVFEQSALFQEGGISEANETLWFFQYLPFLIKEEGNRTQSMLREFKSLSDFLLNLPNLFREKTFLDTLRLNRHSKILIPGINPGDDYRSISWQKNLSFLYYDDNLPGSERLFVSPLFPASDLRPFRGVSSDVLSVALLQALEEGKVLKKKKMLSAMKNIFTLMRGAVIIDNTSSEAKVTNMLTEYFGALLKIVQNPISRTMPVLCDAVLSPVRYPDRTFFNTWDYTKYLNLLYMDTSIRTVCRALNIERNPEISFQFLKDAIQKGWEYTIEKFWKSLENKEVKDESEAIIKDIQL